MIHCTQNYQSISSDNYHDIANALDNWCLLPTIQRWVTSREGLYRERGIPLFSSEKKQKHLIFTKRLLNKRGRGSGKYLLINFDEKRFWGILARNATKCFEDVELQVMKIYHISKTMCIYVVICI